jgi:signal transduction histidine kinase/ligand-binding sensor domain-containing protein/DNA-binding response OmpR family regulator
MRANISIEMTSRVLIKILAIIFLTSITLSVHALTFEKLKFRHLTEENGLTNSHIHAICQDGKGFIWIGTENGLYRYDGFRFKHYINIPGDTSSINSNVVFRIFNDSYNNLWIGTFLGLLRYDESNDRFCDLHLNESYKGNLPTPIDEIIQLPDGLVVVVTAFGLAKINPENFQLRFYAVGNESPFYSGVVISTYYVDRQGNHWMGTLSGVEMYNPLTNTINRMDLNKYASKKFNNCFIHRIYQDTKLNVWVATRENGVFFKPANSNVFQQFYYQENNKFSLGSNETYDIWEDESGHIFISTNGGGLNMYNETTGTFLRLKHDVTDRNSLLNNNIRTIYSDRQGNLWITSFQAGVNILVNHPQLFKNYDVSNESNIEYQSSTVSSIYLESKDLLWIGTDGGGLKLFNRTNNSVKTFLPNKEIRGSFPDKVVMSIYKDMKGDFWFGTYQGGLSKYDVKNQKFITYTHDPEDPESIGSNFIVSMVEDHNGNFWVGTSGGGLNLFNRSTGKFKSFRTIPGNPNSIVDNYLNTIIVDHQDNIWIGSYWGLSRFDVKNNKFANYRNDKVKSNSLSQNTVVCLYEDRNQNLWIGTRNGLNLYNYNQDNFTCFTEKDGLADNIINSILGDKNGNIWISTNYGITKFNPEKRTTINFTESDGLQGNEFYRNSGHIGKNGELFFGGINGFTAFYPDSVKQSDYAPQVIVTGFRIFEHEVSIGKYTDGRVLLKKNIIETKELTLKYSDKIFSFELAAIDFIAPQSIVYAYKIEGFDNNWNYTDARYPIVTYTNLSPGEYKLKIKAANRNIIHEIEPGVSIDIKITPPFWKTWWAFIIYLITIVSLSYYFWRLSIQRVKDRNLVKLEKLKREKSEEINQTKLRFFTNISHEFRTPLTLIIGPLEKLLSNEKETQHIRMPLNMMLKNARRMLRLINQLLDLRKFENEKMKLRTENSDIIKFIEDIIHSFEEYAIEKRINFRFKTSIDSFMTWFDADKLDKILFNLLSNAFKFTPEKGTITVEINFNVTLVGEELLNPSIKNYVDISVTDTGIGIPEKDLPNLFERFYQAGNKQSFHQGSGLGLSLTKNMVEIHCGKITVTTEQNKGTTFHVYLPQDSSYLTDEQKVNPETPGMNQYIHIIPEGYISVKEENIKKPHQAIPNTPTLLLVEDHIDLRIYLEDEFKNRYNFYSASNGKEGFELAIEIMPDVIISDIMMPEMNGLQMCNLIKNNIVTSHIPVILLTAKTSTDNLIAGYESGADAYVPKPFRIDELTATINSVVENRIRLREKYSSNKGFLHASIKNTADDKFIQKATDSVLKNIGEVNFGVLELSKDIGISRVHLHRKLKAIANISPNEFIRNIRLNKSGELLLQREFTISEICYKVGFNSPAYFSSCFKNYFQMSPTEFIEKNG